MEKNLVKSLRKRLIIEFVIIHALIILGGAILHSSFKYSIYENTIFILYNLICGILGFRIGTLAYKLYENIRRINMDR